MRDGNILTRPRPGDFATFAGGTAQRFIVTVDTEEEFDWNGPITRDNHGLEHVPALDRFQQFCEGNGVVPIYLIDYPVATSTVAAEFLKAPVALGKAEIGMQLHPWVNPPFDEQVSEFNSYAGNLPAELEREKFRQLRDAIERNFDCAPLIYRAGRYGVGPNSAAMLSDGGIAIDTSVRSLFDYGHSGGPNFRDFPLHPYWIDREARLLELPLTSVFWGPLRQLGPWLYPRLWRTPTMRGALSRSGLLERIALTPEGISADEAMRGIDIALDMGLPILVFSFHSPSLAPGHTPYVRNDADLDAFYDWWRAVFAYLGRRKVASTSVKDILRSVALA